MRSTTKKIYNYECTLDQERMLSIDVVAETTEEAKKYIYHVSIIGMFCLPEIKEEDIKEETWLKIRDDVKLGWYEYLVSRIQDNEDSTHIYSLACPFRLVDNTNGVLFTIEAKDKKEAYFLFRDLMKKYECPNYYFVSEDIEERLYGYDYKEIEGIDYEEWQSNKRARGASR